MQSQSHTHSPDPDGERLNRIMSNFSLDIMAETSMLEDEGYFQDSSGNTYYWKKVTDDPPSQEPPPASPPRDKGKRRMDDTLGPSPPHSDRCQSSKTSQDPPSRSSPPKEDYGSMVSHNFASIRYAPEQGRNGRHIYGSGREPTSGKDTVTVNIHYRDGSLHQNESQNNHNKAPLSGLQDWPPRDTAPEDKIPVIEIGGYPPGQPPDSMFPIPVNDSQGSFSSGDSIVRESEAPGEQLIYDSPHRALMLASKPGGEYHEGVLRVFHDEARKQIRLYIKIALYAESQLVKLKARQYDLRYLTRSRTGVMGNIYKRTELPAGLELLGHGINPDEQDNFTSYRSVVIEFENNTEQDESKEKRLSKSGVKWRARD
ncbi:hypothetical protein HOO65_060448 [Ceratocystis lukuohia]|uniref:Uncharacterized protein n=1 Tax=Ceratocystis lukuohia TaxID=2019550 RepID=A0ABR4MEF9_9PEZI